MATDAPRLVALIERHRDEIVAVAARHTARSVAVFGSIARGDAGPDRDVDLLVEFESDSSLFDLMSLEDALRDLLGRPVDVVSAGALRDRDDDIRGDLLRL
jgi:predicted nucleotidyltransferase